MQQVLQATAAAVNSYHLIQVRLALPGQTNLAAASISYSTGINGSDSLEIGGAASASMEISLDRVVSNLTGTPAAVYWSTDVGGEYPWITGKITDQREQGGQSIITVRDAMYTAGGGIYEPDISVQVQCSALDALNDLAGKMGVEIDPETAELARSVTLSTLGVGPLHGMSYMEAAGHIAAVMGGNAVMTRAGKLAIKRFSHSGFASESYAGADSADSSDFYVTGVIFYTPNNSGAEIEYTAGEGPNWLRFESPIADDNLAAVALATLSGISIRTGNAEFPGGLLLEPGDIFTAVTQSGRLSMCVTQIRMEWDGGVRTSIVSAGAELYSGGAKGAIQKQLAKITGKTFEMEKSIDGLKFTATETKEIAENAASTAGEANIALKSLSTDFNAMSSGLSATIVQEISSFKDWEQLDKNIAEISLTANGLEIDVSSSTSKLDATANNLNEFLGKFNKSFRFDTEGLHIKDGDGGFESVYSGEKLSFWLNGNEVAYISNNKLYITSAHITGTLTAGSETETRRITQRVENGVFIMSWS